MLLRLLRRMVTRSSPCPPLNATKFVGFPTLEALSGNPVSTDVFERVPEVNHVRQAEQADAVVIAPATADLLARLAAGRADDLLSATVLTTHAPVILAPAMHTQMWENPATRANVQTLRSWGYHVIEPAIGRLTGPDSGPGRMPEPGTSSAWRRRLSRGSRSVPRTLCIRPATPRPSPCTPIRSRSALPQHAWRPWAR